MANYAPPFYLGGDHSKGFGPALETDTTRC